MRAVNDLGLSWEAVIFGEPTELKLASGHKGLLDFTLSAQGKASHSGYPDLGINANSLLLPALVALDKLVLPSSEALGNSTLNIGRIEGGVAANVIPAFAQAHGSVRIAAGSPDGVKDMMVQAVKEIGSEGLKLEFGIEDYGPVHVDSDVEGTVKISLYTSWGILASRGSNILLPRSRPREPIQRRAHKENLNTFFFFPYCSFST
jgi:acetylornithine deacetylase